MLIPTKDNDMSADWREHKVLMPLRASCSFQRRKARCVCVKVGHGLNAPQGFMLIPTAKTIDNTRQGIIKRLNAPQGFMLIPTLLLSGKF